MKKLLLLFVAAIATLSSSAKVVKVVVDKVKADFAAANDEKMGAGFAASVEGFNISFYKNQSGNDLVAPTDLLKLYKNATMVIATTGEEDITSIILKCTEKYVYNCTWSEGTEAIDGTQITWEGSTKTLTVSASNGQIRVSEIIICTNGDKPAAEADITNTAETAYSVSKAVELIEAGEGLSATVFVKGIISQVDSYNEKYGSITYWISEDGTTNGQQFECYSGLNIGGEKFTSAENLVVGSEVVVKGIMKKYTPKEGDPIYEFDKNNEVVSNVAPTAISAVSADKAKVAKLLKNGRMVIYSNGKMFNAAGVEVK